MKRIDIMTDIETLGNKTDSTIIQLAAVAFDIETQEVYGVFNEVIDITNADDLKVTGSTLSWWLNTDKELLAQLINKGTEVGKDTREVFEDFLDWIEGIKNKQYAKTEDIYLWGNGILFDNKMIQHQLELLGLKYPIYYRNDRDLRTLLELASTKLDTSESDIRLFNKRDDDVKHDALSDVLFQIRVASYCYNVLIK